MSRTPRKNSAASIEEYCVPEQGTLHCACSRDVVTKTGTGATTQRHFKKKFFYLQQTGEREFLMWALNHKFVPTGKKKEISLDEVMSGYHPEVSVYVSKVAPAIRKLTKHLARGEKHRRNKQPFSAEMEFKGALEMDKENVRATFGLGLTYLDFGEVDKGRTVFENLVEMEGAFDEEYKHLFNEFGIKLRKNGLYDEAVRYYARALELSQDDENLHFNLGRSHFENEQWLDCLVQLSRTMEMNPAHSEGLEFWRYLYRKVRMQGSQLRLGLDSLGDEVESRLRTALETDPEGLHIHLADLRNYVQKAQAGE